MDAINDQSRVQLKQKLLKFLRAAPTAGLLLASTTLSVPTADASLSRTEPRVSIEERVSNVRKQIAEQAKSHPAQEGTDNLLAWGNWHNWHNGWPNGWHNWHNWRNHYHG